MSKLTIPALLPVAPASFFAMTLGLAEAGNAWTSASHYWKLPAFTGHLLEILAILSFLWWIMLYANKWLNHRAIALAEWQDPVQSAFIALIPESILLLALAFKSLGLPWAETLFWCGSIANVTYAVFWLARNWRGGRSPEQLVPNMFLVYSASVLVNAMAAGIFGYADYGFVLLGAGAISWLLLDPAVTQQLLQTGLAVKTRNFMGIFMAPSVILFTAYQVLAGDQVNDIICYLLMGYSLLISFAMLFTYPWLRQQPFAAGYWAYTFGVATLTQGLISFADRTSSVWIYALAWLFLLITSLLVVLIAAGTVCQLWQRNYYPSMIKPVV